MQERRAEKKLIELAGEARAKGYTIMTPKLFVDKCYGKKLAYYNQAENKIVIDEHYIENANKDEIYGTIIHELAHAIAEQNNKEKKAVWHGQVWKDINTKLGGDAERFHKGGYKKPEYKKKSMEELYAIQPKYEATRWEKGTYKQWLERGYHVIKGQKGQFTAWEFVGSEYESTDGKQESGWGRASAVYFSNEQVEPNEKKGKK